ncbi:hypothetical protein HNR33_001610 [Brassicibacter mesophilus]
MKQIIKQKLDKIEVTEELHEKSKIGIQKARLENKGGNE